MEDSIDKNMIDKDEYPQTAEIESRCVHIMADLWHAPDAATDDRLLDDRVERSGDARRARAQVAVAQAPPGGGQARDRPNLVCGPVQVCWEKFARYFDVELREIPLAARRHGHDARSDSPRTATRTRSASCPRSA